MTNASLAAPRDLLTDITFRQRQASDPFSSVWVGASAGSGKTKVLADRVTRLLLTGVSPQRILCLTFTRAAAAEMSIRLMQRLSEWAICAEEALDKELSGLEGDAFDPVLRDRARRLFARVLSCPGGMRIQTIHGFAQEILRRFPLEAGLPAHFALIEEGEAAALRQEAIEAAFERAAEENDAALDLIARMMAEQSLRSLLQDLLGQSAALRKMFQTHGGFEKTVHAMRSALDLMPDETEDSLRRRVVAEGQFARDALREAAQIVAERGSKTFAPRGASILHWLAQDEEGRLVWLDDYIRAFLRKDGEPYDKVANVDVLKIQPEIEQVIRTEEKRIISFLERRDSIRAAKETEAVLSMALRVIEIYEAKKAERAALDYDDLIQKAQAVLLRPGLAPWVLYKLDGGIDHILVDESQDTNPGQWEIVRALVEEYTSGDSARSDRNRTLFVVGDEKQSIFSFQGADPKVFFEMRQIFKKRFEESKKVFEEVPLHVSFRSAPAVLRAVDAVFADQAVCHGVSTEEVRHQAFRAQGAGRVEVWPLFLPPEDEKAARVKEPEKWVLPAGYETANNPAAELARMIAIRIAEGIAKGETVYDKETRAQRPMNAGDVMVLVRTRGAFVNHLVRELKARNLPVAGVDRMILTRQIAVMDLMALLQFALLPQDDLNLATILRGPLIGASEDELMALAIGREGSLWGALKDSLRGKDSQKKEGKNFAAWLSYLQKIAALADRVTPLALLMETLSNPCPADERSGRCALMRRLGPDAEDPIDELLNAAESFSARRSPSLQAFVQELLFSETQIKRELEQAMGRVRIITVHASKGLEAPIVILPDTTSLPSKTQLSKLVWEAGLSFYVPREPSHAKLKILREKAYERQMEEYRRLLYVAMTRAADRLIVAGYKTSREALANDCWYHLMAEGLKSHHQPEVLLEKEAIVPEIVLADYAVLEKKPAEKSNPMPLSLQEGLGDVALPSFLLVPPASEPSPPRPLVPSRPSEPEPGAISPQDSRFARGRIIHRLLQSLPEVEESRREAVTRRFLANPQHELTDAQQQEIADEVLQLFSDELFAPFFAKGSQAEIPIIGFVGERLVSGQVDRLVVREKEVWIVDYKTNRPPPANEADAPALYRSQMETYRAVLKEIYPNQMVRCFLLWTHTSRLMEILPRT